MPDGIGPGKGYDIIVNGQHRSFRDLRQTAHEAAHYLKSRHEKDLVQIRDCGTGEVVAMMVDGRTG